MMRVGKWQGAPLQAQDQFIKKRPPKAPLGPRSPSNKHFLLSVRDWRGGGVSSLPLQPLFHHISDSIYTSVSKIVPRGEPGIFDSNPLNPSPFARLMVGEPFMDLSRNLSRCPHSMSRKTKRKKKSLLPSLTCSVAAGLSPRFWNNTPDVLLSDALSQRFLYCLFKVIINVFFSIYLY